MTPRLCRGRDTGHSVRTAAAESRHYSQPRNKVQCYTLLLLLAVTIASSAALRHQHNHLEATDYTKSPVIHILPFIAGLLVKHHFNRG